MGHDGTYDPQLPRGRRHGGNDSTARRTRSQRSQGRCIDPVQRMECRKTSSLQWYNHERCQPFTQILLTTPGPLPSPRDPDFYHGCLHVCTTADPQYPSKEQMDVIDATQIPQPMCSYICPVRIRTLIECHSSVRMLSSAGKPVPRNGAD